MPVSLIGVSSELRPKTRCFIKTIGIRKGNSLSQRSQKRSPLFSLSVAYGLLQISCLSLISQLRTLTHFQKYHVTVRAFSVWKISKGSSILQTEKLLFFGIDLSPRSSTVGQCRGGRLSSLRKLLLIPDLHQQNKDFTETLAQQLKGYYISSARGNIQ